MELLKKYCNRIKFRLRRKNEDWHFKRVVLIMVLYLSVSLGTYYFGLCELCKCILLSLVAVDLLLFKNDKIYIYRGDGYMEDNQELYDLKAKVNKIEYTEIKELKEEIQQVKIDLNTNNILTKQCTESNDKMSNTLDTLKDTMIEVAQSVKDSNRVTSELASTVKDLNDKVKNVESTMDKKFDEVNERIEVIDDKGKFDWMLFLKHNAVGILLGIGALIYALSQLGINL